MLGWVILFSTSTKVDGTGKHCWVGKIRKLWGSYSFCLLASSAGYLFFASQTATFWQRSDRLFEIDGGLVAKNSGIEFTKKSKLGIVQTCLQARLYWQLPLWDCGATRVQKIEFSAKQIKNMQITNWHAQQGESCCCCCCCAAREPRSGVHVKLDVKI